MRKSHPHILHEPHHACGLEQAGEPKGGRGGRVEKEFFPRIHLLVFRTRSQFRLHCVFFWKRRLRRLVVIRIIRQVREYES